jgi:hypothetical protein
MDKKKYYFLPPKGVKPEQKRTSTFVDVLCDIV